MPHRFVDISVPLETGIRSDPDRMLPKIAYRGRQETANDLCALFPGLRPERRPSRMGWAVEEVELATQNGTHMDAPWRYHPTMDGGERAITVDEIPLKWCYQTAVKLDFSHPEDGYVMAPSDIEAELERIGQDLKPPHIVVANTAAGTRYGENGYLHTGCGFGRDATLWLTARGVRVVGTDAWSWDAPFARTLERWKRTKDPSIISEGHKAGMERGYRQIEKLGNLESLPSTGFDLICFPARIQSASAGWTRAV